MYEDVKIIDYMATYQDADEAYVSGWHCQEGTNFIVHTVSFEFL